MKYLIDLNKTESKTLRLYRNVEYILSSDDKILLYTNKDGERLLYPKCLGNGTSEVYILVSLDNVDDIVELEYGNRKMLVSWQYNEFVLANHLEDIMPSFIQEDYPLFKKMLEYYFKYTGSEFNPSGFIHNMEKYSRIDETFDEFKQYIYDEVLHYLPENTIANKDILSKYILDFYNRRGTEESILFLIRILFNLEAEITRGRDGVLIPSDNIQGRISDRNIVIQDNYLHMLYSYVITLPGVYFDEYKDVLYTLVNPSGYLPFGRNINPSVRFNLQNKDYEEWTHLLTVITV